MTIKPQLGTNVFVAESADVIGNVIIGEDSSVWYQAVIRGRMNGGEPIRIGSRTNVQDGCFLHQDPSFPLTIGDDVTIGHRAVVHGCTIGDNCLIGMGAIIMNGAVIGDNCLIGAGAMVTQNTVVPEGQLVLGSPAKIRRPLTEEEIASIRESAAHYVTEAGETLL